MEVSGLRTFASPTVLVCVCLALSRPAISAENSEPPKLPAVRGQVNGSTAGVARSVTNVAAARQEGTPGERKLRDPFWPVGYTPGQHEPTNTISEAPKPPPVAPPRWKEATRTLTIKGVLRVSEGKYVAMINDQIVGEGDTVEAVFAGRRYRWRVKGVSRDGVRFQPVESHPLPSGAARRPE